MTMVWTSFELGSVTVDMARESSTLPTSTGSIANFDVEEFSVVKDLGVDVTRLGGLPKAMVEAYADAAARHAYFVNLESGGHFAAVSGLDGVWGEGPTKDAAREDLRESIIDWVVVRLDHELVVPPIEGLDLNL